jgi:ABC-type spermidine/putrescine transport system permease subunit I
VHRARLKGVLLASPPIVVVAVFIGFPIVAAILYSFGYGGGPNSVVSAIAQDQHLSSPGLNLGAYRDVFDDPSFGRSLKVTVVVTVAATVVTLVLATVIALYARLAASRLARTLSAMAIVPLFIPVVIGSYALLTFYAKDGFLASVASWLHLPQPVFSYTLTGVAIGEIWTSMPFAVLMLTSGFAAVPDALIEASRDVGSSTLRTVRSVILPMANVPLIIAATFTAIGILGSFTVPYLIGPTAPNLLGPDIEQTFGPFNRAQQAQVMAVVLFLLASAIGVAYVWANFRASRRSSGTS